MINQPYTVWIHLNGNTIAAADLQLATDERGRYQRSALRYRSDYLQHPNAVALHPAHAPLSLDIIEWNAPHIPGLLDDLLPGLWERRVLARHRQAQGDTRDPGDPSDLHALLETRRAWPPGAIHILPAAQPPTTPDWGQPLDHIQDALTAAEQIIEHEEPNIQGLQRLNQGSSLGGARPKLAVQHNHTGWIAKLNTNQDHFNYVRVEHACLELAKACGLHVASSQITAIGHHEILLVKRFDDNESNRLPLHSANSFLKDATTQQDPAFGSYNDLASLVRQYSHNVSHDLQQLAGQMLFNNCINNRDDHLRNFSFLGSGTDLALSPAYDLVPSEALGVYPQLNFNQQPWLPKLSETEAISKAFQLTPKETQTVVNQIEHGLEQWPTIFKEAGVNDSDRRLMQQLIVPR